MQANDHPPAPPNSKFLSHDNSGNLRILLFDFNVGELLPCSVSALLEHPDEQVRQHWRTIIGAVAAEEWRQEGERRLADNWQCYIPTRDAINAWRKWAQGEKP